jgi:hypothetical protein
MRGHRSGPFFWAPPPASFGTVIATTAIAAAPIIMECNPLTTIRAYDGDTGKTTATTTGSHPPFGRVGV